MQAIDASAVSAPVNEAQTGSAFIEPHSESEVCLSLCDPGRFARLKDDYHLRSQRR